MTEADTRQFRCSLQHYRSEAIEILHRSGDVEFDLEIRGDVADMSTFCSSKEAWFERTVAVRHMLGLIEDALQRIREGTFGVCRNCGDEIGKRRLEALPWTEYCLRCQEAVETTVNAGSNSRSRPYTSWKYTA